MSAWSYEGNPALPKKDRRGPETDYHAGWQQQLDHESRRSDGADNDHRGPETAAPTTE